MLTLLLVLQAWSAGFDSPDATMQTYRRAQLSGDRGAVERCFARPEPRFLSSEDYRKFACTLEKARAFTTKELDAWNVEGDKPEARNDDMVVKEHCKLGTDAVDRTYALRRNDGQWKIVGFMAERAD